MQNALILVITLIWSLISIGQGPIDGFMKGEGNLDGALGFTVQQSNNYYGASNQEFDLNYQANLLSFFAQYGITDYLDAVVSLPFIFANAENKFQDMGLFLKARPLHYKTEKHFEFSTILSGGYTFPASDYKPDVTGALGQRAQTIPLRGILQAKLPIGLFINGTGTFNFRTDPLSSQISEEALDGLSQEQLIPSNFTTSMIRLGFATNKHFIEVFLERQTTFGGVDFVEGEVRPPQLYGVDFTKIGGTYYYDVDANGIAINAAYILNGRNIGNIVNVGVSFIIKYRKENDNRKESSLLFD